MRAVFLCSLFLLSSLLPAQTLHLRDRVTNPTLTVSSVSSSTPPVLTFTSAHGLAVNDHISCIGFSGLPLANTTMKVKATPTTTTITIKDTSNVDIAGNNATNVDLDTSTIGNQVGFCGKLTQVTATGAGWFPLSGAYNTRIKDPDGGGASVAPVVALDPAAWADLEDENNLITTATCDGSTVGLCTAEEGLITNGTFQVNEGWPILNLALGWYGDNSKTRWLNGAKYLFANIHRVTPQRPYFTACDKTASHCGQGQYNDWANFFPSAMANAFALIKTEMSAGEITAFLQKILNDQTTPSVTEILPDLAGGVRASPSSTTITGDTGEFASVSVNDRIYIKTAHRNYKISDSTLTSVAVSGTTATITVGGGHTVPANGSYTQIAGSTISNLDGWYTSSGATATTFNVTVASVVAGTYTTAGMNVRVPGSSDSTGVWRTVTAKASNQQITVDTATSSTTYYTNAPWSKLGTWSSTTYGLLWYGWHHADTAPQPGARWGTPNATVTPSATSFALNTATYDAFKTLTPPYYVSSNGEIMLVTAQNDGTRTLTVSRGQFLTPAQQHTTGAIIAYQPIGPNTSVGATGAHKSLGSYAANLTHRHVAGPLSTLAPLLTESARARELFEYYWNWYQDLEVRRNSETWAGLTHSGPGSPGYYFGSWADMFLWSALVGRNSFDTSIDLVSGFPGLEAAYISAIYLTRADSPTRHMSWSDSGGLRTWEVDDFKGFEASPFLFPSSAPTLLSFIRAGFPTTFHRETISYRLTYGGVALGDYTNLPTKRIAQTSATGNGNPFMLGGASFRQDWTTTTGTSGWIIVTTGYDHNASYPIPGALVLTKGDAEFICGSSTGCALFGDARTQNGVEVYTTTPGVTGGLTASASYTPSNGPAYTQRGNIGSDYLYVRVKNERYNTTMNATSAHRDFLYLDPGSGGQDYAITYDRILTPSGRTKVFRIPYYRRTNADGTSIQSPVPTYTRSNEAVVFDSNQYGKRLRTRMLTPTTADATYTYSDDTSNTSATRLTITTTNNDADFLAVHRPCADLTCTAATHTLLSSSSTHRVGQTDNGSQVWIYAFAKDPASTATSLAYTAAIYSGTGRHVITGLNPNTVWDVLRDGVEIFADQVVNSQGVLRFDATFGSGAFSLTSGGSVPLEITITSVAGCLINAPYNVQLQAIGGTSPYTWAVTVGSLPSGVTLSSSGLLSGACPSMGGTSNFTVQATDAVLATDTQALSIVVTAPDLPTITNSSLATGTVDISYSQTLTATGGTAPYTFALAAGSPSLPNGLMLASNGAITGTPTVAGTVATVFEVTDDDTQVATSALSITINPAAATEGVHVGARIGATVK